MVRTRVACMTQRDQIFFRIVARVAPEFFVVDFKIGSSAARLTSPAIATQHLVAQLFVTLGIELQTRLLRPHAGHAACSVTESKNTFRSSLGRNWKKRRADCKSTPGFSFSKLAPRVSLAPDQSTISR